VRLRTAGALVAVLLLGACGSSHPAASTSPTPNSTKTAAAGATPSAGTAPLSPGATVSTTASPVPGKTVPGKTAGAGPNPTSSPRSLNPLAAGGTSSSSGGTTTIPAGGSSGSFTFSAPLSRGGPASPAPSAQPTCVKPADPATTIESPRVLTGSHLDSVDTLGNPHTAGVDPSFSAATNHQIWAVLDVQTPVVTGTVLTFVQLLCSQLVAQGTNQVILGPTTPPNIVIKLTAQPTFTTGYYQLQFFIGDNAAPSQVLDYTVTP
jgi:hypothetical protein